MSAAIWTRFEQGPAEFSHTGFPDLHVLVVRLQLQKIERWFDGRQARDEDGRLGASYLMRAGVPSRFICYGGYRTFTAFLPTSLLELNAREIGTGTHILESLGSVLTYDSMVHDLATWAVGELRAGGPISRMQLDGIGMMFGVHLLRRAACMPAELPAMRGGLAGWQLKRIDERIAADLAQDLGLSCLASAVGLSPYHFARAFKRSTGLSPHRYVLRTRLERAKELLATSDLSIADIAARIGYQDHPSQLSRLFRRELGVTPQAYRRIVLL